MTREGAINKLNWALDNNTIENVQSAYDYIIALKMAIKALEQIPDLKEAYNKGYKDGQDALAFHLELCKDEGSVITVPEGATNGDMIKAMFPDAEVIAVENEEMEIVEYVVKIDVETAFTAEWWNAPYRKEQE